MGPPSFFFSPPALPAAWAPRSPPLLVELALVGPPSRQDRRQRTNRPARSRSRSRRPRSRRRVDLSTMLEADRARALARAAARRLLRAEAGRTAPSPQGRRPLPSRSNNSRSSKRHPRPRRRPRRRRISAAPAPRSRPLRASCRRPPSSGKANRAIVIRRRRPSTRRAPSSSTSRAKSWCACASIPRARPSRSCCARPSGFQMLDRAAIAAVKSWHFLPAMRDGRPVSAWVEIPVRFHLRNKTKETPCSRPPMPTLRPAGAACAASSPRCASAMPPTTLGVSEAELVATGIGTTATPLAADWRSILSEMPSVGRVMCLTRNEHCVHERHGRFEDVQVTGPHGLVLGPDIDLRLFLGSWKHGFAVREPIEAGRAAQPAVLRRRGRGGAQDLRHRRDRPAGVRCLDRAPSRRSAGARSPSRRAQRIRSIAPTRRSTSRGCARPGGR